MPEDEPPERPTVLREPYSRRLEELPELPRLREEEEERDG
jgi:hypothetical protein